jgi:hypothetical protein
MFPLWLILGIITIVMGIFNRKIMERLGSKPNSEVFITSGRKHSARIIDQIGRWLMVTLGASFFILGLGGALPAAISQKILFGLSGLAGLMLLAMIGITLSNWKTR